MHGDSIGSYDDLMVGIRGGGFVPDVWLRTEDRIDEGVTLIPDDGTELFDDSENAELRAVRIKHVKEYRPLDGFRGDLHMSSSDAGHDCMEPDLCRVVESRVTCYTRHHGRFTRTVIFVAVESLEFAMRFWIPHDVRVSAIYQRGYYVGFNLCKVEGAFMRKIARVLGARWYYSDSNGLRSFHDISGKDTVYRAFPSLRNFAEIGLLHVPMLDPVGVSSESGSNDEVKCHLVGATSEEAEALADVVSGEW